MSKTKVSWFLFGVIVVACGIGFAIFRYTHGGYHTKSGAIARSNELASAIQEFPSGPMGGILGHKKWAFNTSGAIFFSTPAIGSNGTIYVGSRDGNLYAINPNGAKKWVCKTGKPIASSPAIGPGGVIYVGSGDNDLYAINPNGTKMWICKISKLGASSSKVAADGSIYIGSRDGNLYAINPNGTKKWAFQFQKGTPILFPPAIAADGTIYVGSGSDLYAINRGGTKKWALQIGGNVSSPAIGRDGTIYAGDADGSLYAVNSDGVMKWSLKTGTIPIILPPIIASDGTIYLCAGPSLYAINPNGTKKWASTTGGPINFPPAIGKNGMIYVGYDDVYDQGGGHYCL